MDAHTEKQVRQDALLVTGLTLEQLGAEQHRARGGLAVIDESRDQAELLAGCLWTAASILLDQLFEDLGDMARDRGPAPALADETWLGQCLPEAFGALYGEGFVRQFIICTATVISRLNTQWRPLASTAEELATVFLIDQVTAYAETFEIPLAPNWREGLLDELIGDRDFQQLYSTASVPPAALDWFEPFGADPVSPFLVRTSANEPDES